MTTLGEMARVLRSKNAGPLTLTIDVLFDDEDSYERVARSGIINRRTVGDLYGVDEDDVLITEYRIVNAIKISFPRKHVSGSVLDDDVYGCQQHRPFAELVVDEPKESP